MKAGIPVKGPFDLAATLESGQAFRWQSAGAGYAGVASGHHFKLAFRDGFLIIESPSCDDPGNWAGHYFDLSTDYDGLTERLRQCDESIRSAVEFAPGLRLLQQEPWEVLISFILSANNNIPRIKQLVGRLCSRWGERKTAEDLSWWGFPAPGALAGATEAEIRQCGAGFRARAVLEAAQRVSSGELDLIRLATLPTREAREMLLTLWGVGPKVANCVLLFGLGKIDSFPIDVWVKRGLEAHYFRAQNQRLTHLQDFAEGHFACDAGYAQNYLFYHARCTGAGKRPRRVTAERP
jgi:N-glycosylase/DNA lyase